MFYFIIAEGKILYKTFLETGITPGFLRKVVYEYLFKILEDKPSQILKADIEGEYIAFITPEYGKQWLPFEIRKEKISDLDENRMFIYLNE